MRRLAGALAAMALLAVLAGCSDDGPPDQTQPVTTETSPRSTAPSSPSAAGLEAAVRDYTAAFGAGDEDLAVSLLTDRCQQLAGPTVRQAVVQIASAAPDLTVTEIAVDIEGSAATVTYETSTPEYSQIDERWLVEGGAWRNDDC